LSQSRSFLINDLPRVFGGVRVAHRFSFLSCVLCAHCFQCLWKPNKEGKLCKLSRYYWFLLHKYKLKCSIDHYAWCFTYNCVSNGRSHYYPVSGCPRCKGLHNFPSLLGLMSFELTFKRKFGCRLMSISYTGKLRSFQQIHIQIL
jgi:hypothetical protein